MAQPTRPPVTSAPPPQGWAALDEPARRWVLGVAALTCVLVAALPLLALAYSSDELVTIYGIGVLALMCQGAEAVDGWQARTGRRGLGLAGTPMSACTAMRWVIVAVTGYLGLVGLTDLLSGLSGNHSSTQSAADLAASGALITTASVISLLLFWHGSSDVPGWGRLRPRAPITWFAIAAMLQALAQNLSPAAGAQSVASTIARPVTAGDLIIGSLPFGAIAVMGVGPVVRRNAGACLRRLGLTPLRLGWAAGGLATGVVLVTATNAAFGASELTLREAVLHLGPLGLVLVAVGDRRSRGFVLDVLRPPPLPPDDEDATVPPPSTLPLLSNCLRVLTLAVIAFALVDAIGLAVSLLGERLPADCVAQQIRVTQSLSGGPTGRTWYANSAIALTAAVDEELLFRGALQPRVGLVWSALLFASFHLQYTCHGLPSVGDVEIVILGFVFGVLRQRGGLPAAILCHAAYDATILLGF
ncbi:MAG TPA: CPBP family intramembrane glutamic endopeptidase [Candidatus Dormibacteraeota bacterium]